MKIFAIIFVFLLSSVELFANAASICDDRASSKRFSIRNGDSTASEKSSDVNEKSNATAVTDTTTSAPKPSGTTEISEVKLFFRTVQCTLEKAQPLVEEIEKEAKRFGETAKRFGESFISSITELVDKLVIPSFASNIGGGGGGAGGFGGFGGGASVVSKPDDVENADVEIVEIATEKIAETIGNGESSTTSTTVATVVKDTDEVTDDNIAANEIF